PPEPQWFAAADRPRSAAPARAHALALGPAPRGGGWNRFLGEGLALVHARALSERRAPDVAGPREEGEERRTALRRGDPAARGLRPAARPAWNRFRGVRSGARVSRGGRRGPAVLRDRAERAGGPARTRR